MKEYPVMTADGHLAANDIWNIPTDTNEVRGNLKTQGRWSIPVSYRALAMDMHGRVFGIRTMSNVRESGHELEGRVSIEGKKYRAFTSSKLFTRNNGTLCDVAIVYVCGTPNKQWPDPLKVPPEAYRAYIRDLHDRYFYETEGLYKTLRDYCQYLEWHAEGAYAHMQEQWLQNAKELREELVGPMGW